MGGQLDLTTDSPRGALEKAGTSLGNVVHLTTCTTDLVVEIEARAME